MKVDHRARAEEKAKKMKNPDWHKYSGWPPEEPAAEKKPKKKSEQPEETYENGDGN